MAAKNRPYAVQVMVNATERDAVHQAARRHTLSISAYARIILLRAIQREVALDEQRIEQRSERQQILEEARA